MLCLIFYFQPAHSNLSAMHPSRDVYENVSAGDRQRRSGLELCRFT